MKIYICNAFSLSMLDREHQGGSMAVVARKGFVRIPRPVDDPVEWLAQRDASCHGTGEPLEIVSAIDGPYAARFLSTVLGRDLPVNRVNVKLAPGVYVLVGQYIGDRVEWWSV